MTLTRRDVLKGIGSSIAATSFAAAVSGSLIGCDCGEITLNVILHGLFVLDFQGDHIELLTPCVEDHIYKCGSWDKNDIYCMSSAKYATFGVEICSHAHDRYRLRGINKPATETYIQNDFNVVLSKDCIYKRHKNFHTLPELSKFIIELPFPDELIGIRNLKCTEAFAGSDSDLVDADGLSLCQVLVYHHADPNRVTLEGSEWIYGKSPSQNLHIWAEPQHRVPIEHGKAAFNKLIGLIPPLCLSLRVDETPQIDIHTNVLGVEPWEEQGWAEWVNGGEGTRPVNCNSLILK